MENVKIKGLSSKHRSMLLKAIQKDLQALSGPVEIDFCQQIDRKQYDSLWYGGCVAEIRYRGWIFELSACGDIYADIYDIADPQWPLVHVKDKCNMGVFCSEVSSYLHTDKSLNAAIDAKHKKYKLFLDYRNWWECFAEDSHGNYQDFMWVLNDDDLFGGIAEIIGNMEEVIEDSEVQYQELNAAE